MLEKFIMMKAALDERLATKPNGFLYFNQQTLAMLIKAFDENETTVFVSGYTFPTELLWAFDMTMFDLEIACNNLPEALGGTGSTIMKTAEKAGYSQDICSFHRLIYGCLEQGMLPHGDLHLTSTYYCHGKAKIAEVVAERQKKDLVIFDVPNEISRDSVAYVADQLRNIAGRLADLAGRKLEPDRLRTAMTWSNRARSSLLELNELMKHKPCPWDGQRAALLGLGGAMFFGSPIRDEIHRMLINESRSRIESGRLFPEKFRVLWYPWTPVQETNIFKTLKDHQASLVMAEPALVWWSELDVDNPFEAMALKALEHPQVGPPDKRISQITELVNQYQVDGAIHFTTPACYHENATYPLLAKALKKMGIPVLDLDGDMTDERKYFPARTLGKLNDFLGMMAG